MTEEQFLMAYKVRTEFWVDVQNYHISTQAVGIIDETYSNLIIEVVEIDLLQGNHDERIAEIFRNQKQELYNFYNVN